MLSVSLFALVFTCAAQVLQYRFHENFGQIFQDYSSKKYVGVNGESNLTTLFDTIPTDRGAYFDRDQSSYVLLPPNEVAEGPFESPSVLCTSLWLLLLESSSSEDKSFSIISKTGSNSSFALELLHHQERFSVRAAFDEYDSGIVFSEGNGFKRNIWMFLAICVDQDGLHLQANHLKVASLRFEKKWKDDGYAVFQLGKEKDAFIGVVFEINVFFHVIGSIDFIGGSYSPGNCYLHHCQNICNPSYLLNERIFCLPSNTDFEQDSMGNECQRMKGEKPHFGCHLGTNLTCNCKEKSCVLKLNKTSCWCAHSLACDCPDHSYPSEKRCFSCNLDCATCEDPNWCNTCIDQNAIPGAKTGCLCKSGYYNTTRLHHSNSCLICDPLCETCTESSSCSKCKEPNAEPSEDKSKKCICKKGFYGKVNISGDLNCFKCDEQCEDCLSPGSCLTCKDPNAEVNDGNCACNSRYYNNSALDVGGKCLFCSLDCVSCLETGACSACVAKNSRVFDNAGCVCLPGFFNSSALIVSFACQPCFTECLTCSAEKTCIFCVDENASPASQGCECLPGFYNTTALHSSGKCEKCHPDCSSCTESGKCTSCIDSNASPHKSSGCICLEGFTNKTSLSQQGSCKRCHPSCNSCGKDFECLSCISENAKKIDDFLGCECLKGYFSKGLINSYESCQKCKKDCLDCSDGYSCNSCLAFNARPSGEGCICEEGFFNTSELNSELSCLACGDHCRACTELSTCTVCKSLNAEPSFGGCRCKDGFYQTQDLSLSSSCEKCGQGCKSCTSDSCLVCSDPNSIVEGANCICRAGFFNDPSSEIQPSCKACNDDCETCTNNERCKVCKAKNSYLASSGCRCNEGFFNVSVLDSSDSCIKCHPNCFNCTQSDICSKCISQNAFPSKVGCSCGLGYYNISDLLTTTSCLKCHQDCKFCDNNSTCLSCKAKNASPVPSGGCECDPGFHNVSSLDSSVSCTDLDLWSIKMTSNESYVTAYFPFLVTVFLRNKKEEPYSEAINVTLFSYSDDLASDGNLTVEVKNGKAEFEVFCSTQGSNSLAVVIGPVVGNLMFQVMSPKIEILEVRPWPQFQHDNFEVQAALFVFGPGQKRLGQNRKEFWIYLEINPEGEFFGDTEVKTEKGICKFTGLRIASSGLFKVVVKGSGLKTGFSQLIDIKKTPLMALRVVSSNFKPFVGEEFFINATVSDQYGKILGREVEIQVKSDTQLIGSTKAKTFNSSAIFKFRVRSPGDLNLFFLAEDFNSTLSLKIKKNQILLNISGIPVKSNQPSNTKEFFDVQFQIKNGLNGTIQDFGSYLIEVHPEPEGFMKCSENSVETFSGEGKFENCQFLTSGNMSLSLVSNLTEPSVLGPFFISNPEVDSIQISFNSSEISAFFDFFMKVSLLDVQGKVIQDSFLLNVSFEEAIQGPHLLLYNKGKAEGRYYSRHSGYFSFEVFASSSFSRSSVKILPNQLKFLEITPKVINIQPKHINDYFSAVVGVFDNKGSKPVTKSESFNYSIILDPSSGTLKGQNESESSNPFFNFSFLQIEPKGIYSLIVQSEGMLDSQSEKLYIDIPKVDKVQVNENFNLLTAWFEFKVTGQVKDQYDAPWTSPLKVSLSSEVGDFEGLTSNSFFEFIVLIESPGITRFKITADEVVKTFEVFINPQRLGLVSSLPNVKFKQTLKIGNILDVVFGVFDSWGKNIEKSGNHYEVWLEIIKGEDVLEKISGKSYDGYVGFKDISLLDVGVYCLRVSCGQMIAFNSSIRVYDLNVIELNVEQPQDEIKAKYVYNFKVSGRNITQDKSEFIDPKSISFYLNNQKLNPSNSEGNFSSYSIHFPTASLYTLKAKLDDYFYTTEIIVNPSDNEDPLCQISESASICQKCSSKSSPNSGKCECVPKSTLNPKTSKCDCLDDSEESENHCVSCRNYFKTSEIQASFSKCFKIIQVSFERPAADLSLTCKDLIEPGYYSDLVISCTWKSPYLLLLKLRTLPDVNQDLIGFQSKNLLTRAENCTFLIENLELKIRKAFDLPVPEFFIEGPETFSLPCSQKALKARVLPSSEDFIYKWMSNSDPENDNFRVFVASTESNQIEIPFDYLYPSILTLSVRVQLKSLKTFAFKHLVINITDSSVVVPEIITHSAHSDLEKYQISAKISDFCSGNNFTFVWTSPQFESLSKFVDSDKPELLLIPRQDLLNKKVEIHLKLINGLQKIRVKKQLEVPNDQLTLILSRSSGMISNKQDLVIHYTIQNSESSDFEVIWTCVDLTGNCKDDSGSFLSLIFNKSTLFLPKSHLKLGSTLTLTIEVTSSNKSLTETLTFSIFSSIPGSCDLSFPLKKINPFAKFSLLPTYSLPAGPAHSFEWTLSGESLKNESFLSNLPYLVIPAKRLSEGQRYRVEVKVNQNNFFQNLSSFGEVFTSQAPACEEVHVAKDGKNHLVSVVGCVDDDYPLVYQVGCRANDGEIIWMTSPAETSQINVWIPPGSSAVLVKVINKIGTFKVFEREVKNFERLNNDLLMEIMQLTRNKDDIPNIVVYYSKMVIDFPAFSYLYASFYSFFSQSSAFEFGVDLYIACLKSILGVKDLVDDGIVANSTKLTLKIFKEFGISLDVDGMDSILGIYSKLLLSKNDEILKEIVFAAAGALIKDVAPPFKYYFDFGLKFVMVRRLSDVDTEDVVVLEDVSIKIPEKISKNSEDIIDFSYFSISSLSISFDLLLEKSGDLSSYNLNLYKQKKNLESFNKPVQFTFDKKNSFNSIECSSSNDKCSVDTFNSSQITIKLYNSGSYLISESSTSKCSFSTKGISISISFFFIILSASLGFFIRDRKRRLVNPLKFGFCEMFNFSSLFIPRQNLERVVSVFKIASGVLTVFSIVGLTYTKYNFSLLTSSFKTDLFNASQTSRMLSALTISQSLTFLNFLILCGQRNNLKFQKIAILLNFSVMLAGTTVIVLLSSNICFSSPDEWLFISGIGCLIEVFAAQPLMALIFSFFCRRRPEKVETTGTLAAENPKKKKVEIYPLNETQNVMSQRPTYSRVNSNLEDV